MLATLPFSLNFAHPLAEWGLLAVGGWALYLGIKAKKTRTGTPEQRKELVPKSSPSAITSGAASCWP